jgi:hypothetical protein
VTPYAASLVERLGQDSSTLDTTNGRVALCGICGSAVQHAADEIAMQRTQELRAETMAEIAKLSQALMSLAEAVRRLEAKMIFK